MVCGYGLNMSHTYSCVSNMILSIVRLACGGTSKRWSLLGESYVMGHVPSKGIMGCPAFLASYFDTLGALFLLTFLPSAMGPSSVSPVFVILQNYELNEPLFLIMLTWFMYFIIVADTKYKTHYGFGVSHQC